MLDTFPLAHNRTFGYTRGNEIWPHALVHRQHPHRIGPLSTSALHTPENPEPTASPPTFYRTAQVDGLNIFYREAGPKDAPVILLLHGFPNFFADVPKLDRCIS
jgi:hypothetical protein